MRKAVPVALLVSLSARMYQTLLAFIALMVVMLLTINQQQALMQLNSGRSDQEIQSLAVSVGQDVLDFIGAKPFDAATIAGTVTDASALTPSPFTTGGDYETAQDIDDFHQIDPYTYVSEVQDIAYTLNIEVHYVEDEDPSTESSVQTFSKEVVITLSNPDMLNDIQLSRVYTYP